MPGLLMAVALGFGVTSVSAQVVQLPSVRQFSYRGSVLVPDRGTTYLGGNSSSASGWSSRRIPGLPSNPGSRLGSTSTAGGASVSVTIIDLDEMDRQILGEDPRTLAKRLRTNQPGGRNRANGNGIEAMDPTQEVISLVQNARSLVRAGKTSNAQAAYELAISRLKELQRSSPSLQSRQTSGLTTSASTMQNKAQAQRIRTMLDYAVREYALCFPNTQHDLVNGEADISAFDTRTRR
ncbi:hypothetical protein SAMN06265222_101536 [Neorhodopirellula lusitana]|uniref:Secreted protein n=1 Tax=Neorhodopirellula lusitana TaxID=445327 RepID=A0ABY1PPD4_9BACT|nr:hypothetical protein [Neorhodopirellula lusitana]SMP41094.1 hypothetical protein SAMN06265222_101536 [Neorhodopirellula lusitana]